MAFSGTQPVKLVGYNAAADYSAASNQYKFVYISTAEAAGVPGVVTLCTSATTQIPIGVLQNTPKAGLPAEVVVQGFTKVSASSTAITASSAIVIGHDGNAQAAPYTPGTDTTKYNLGRALDSTTGVNQLVSAIIDCVNPSRCA